jgi:HAD superfamily hydrolase (TIGR01509 family)
MTTSNYNYIFDLDGTLYPFVSGAHIQFERSVFYDDLRGRIIGFLTQRMHVDATAAENMLQDVAIRFDGELSIGFEQLHGIDRYEYYAATWSCEPRDYLPAPDQELALALEPFKDRALVLTAAPHIWASKVLEHLGIADMFADRIITGEPDLRKPDPRVFDLAGQKLHTRPSHIVSIGDQNKSDILPAKLVGMKTILIGPAKLDADHRADTIFEALTILKENYL